jgi:hypothetical protein
MAVPGTFYELIDQAEAAARRVNADVAAARYGRDDRAGNPTVGQVRGNILEASEVWVAVTDNLTGALEAQMAANPDGAGELRACQAALLLMHTAVASEVALARALDDYPDDQPLNALPEWPRAGLYPIEKVAFGRDGLFALMREGTDERAITGGDHELITDSVLHTVRSIVEHCASSTTAVVVGVTVSPALDATFPGFKNAAETVKVALEHPVENDLENAVNKIKVGSWISKIVCKVLARARKLIRKLLGDYQRLSITDTLKLVGPSLAKQDLEISLVDKAAAAALHADEVLNAALETVNSLFSKQLQVPRASKSLAKLRGSNERWVGKVEDLAKALGPLWAVVTPIGPVAPYAAAALLIWTFLVSGDQMDSAAHFPKMWVGVDQRVWSSR